MAQAHQIRHVVFDIGAVLLHWQPTEIAQNFTSDPALQRHLLEGVFQSNYWLEMDRGTITEAQARAGFAAATGLPMLQINLLMEQIKESLVALDDTVTIARQLKGKGFGIYCLSNICHEIFDHVNNRYEFFSEFDDIILSAAVKMAKPDPAIYRYMLERFAAQAEQTIFIDDMHANIASAQALGIHGICFTDARACEQAIRDILG